MKAKVTCVGGPLDKTIVIAEVIDGSPCEVHHHPIGITEGRLERYVLHQVSTKDNEGEINEIEVRHFLYLHDSIPCLPIALQMIINAYSGR